MHSLYHWMTAIARVNDYAEIKQKQQDEDQKQLK